MIYEKNTMHVIKFYSNKDHAVSTSFMHLKVVYKRQMEITIEQRKY